MTEPAVPLVSIITPVYNGAGYLEHLLDSVEAQTHPRVEHIVIDDGSTDDGATCAILRRHPRVRWWSRENRGQYATINEGFRAAQGTIITTISADDYYAGPDAVARMAGYLVAHPRCDIAHGVTLHVDDGGTPLPVQPYQGYPHWMLRYNLGFIYHCSMFLRRETTVGRNLLLDESLRYAGDGEWMARLYLAGCRFGRVPTVVAAYRHHAAQTTSVAGVDGGRFERRREERAAIDRQLGQRAPIRRAVDAYVRLHGWRRKAAAAWRGGGWPALRSQMAGFLHRRARAPDREHR